jgi:glucokinase
MKICADVGGTNLRIAYVNDEHQIVFKEKYSISNFPGADVGFVAALNAFLREKKELLETDKINSITVSASGHIKDDRVQFTNTDWVILKSDLSDNFSSMFNPNLEIFLINDFEALAYGLSTIEEGDFTDIFPREGYGDTKLVCGPGTGLGLAALKTIGPNIENLIAIPSEGGHQSFSVETSLEKEIREHMMEGWMSYEDVLSGNGLKMLFNFFNQKNHIPSSYDIAPKEIIDLSNSGNIPARKALEEFSYALGTFCGNMVLALGATKGVYLWGGILKSFPLELLKVQMKRRFQQRGSAVNFLSDVPIFKITNDEIALRGCSIYSVINSKGDL